MAFYLPHVLIFYLAVCLAFYLKYILTFSYRCLVGNGWEWGNGITNTSDYGSFPHSLLSTSKFCLAFPLACVKIQAWPTSGARVSHNKSWYDRTTSIHQSCSKHPSYKGCKLGNSTICMTRFQPQKCLSAYHGSENDGLEQSWLNHVGPVANPCGSWISTRTLQPSYPQRPDMTWNYEFHTNDTYCNIFNSI